MSDILNRILFVKRDEVATAKSVRPLAEVRDRIVHKLKEQQRIANEERFYAEQKAGVNVEINQSALQAVLLPAAAVAKAPGAPPSLPSN